MNKINRWILGLVALFAAVLPASAQTNTISGIYSSVTSGFTSTFDALIALAVGILVVSVGFALVKSMVPHRAKVK